MARKTSKRKVRRPQSKRRREEVRQEKEQFRNRIIAGVGGIFLIAVLVFFVVQLQNNTAEETAEEGTGNGDVARPTTLQGTIIEGERPLADLDPAERQAYYEAYPEMIIDQSKTYQAVIETENGEMVLNLFDNEAPLTVNNFVFLATQGFYDNTVFHRVLEGFMAQGGDPTGTGGGGPGYRFEDEVDNGIVFDQGNLLAMANSGANTNGSQFFITFAPTPHLNGAHTIFGELIQGEEVLNSISLINPENPADQGRVGDEIIRIDIYES